MICCSKSGVANVVCVYRMKNVQLWHLGLSCNGIVLYEWVSACFVILCSCLSFKYCLTDTHARVHVCRDGGKFKRIAVFRGPHGGYGFADPYEFDSLLSLVVYYSTNTMEKHNPGLQAMLTYPAFYVTK